MLCLPWRHGKPQQQRGQGIATSTCAHARILKWMPNAACYVRAPRNVDGWGIPLQLPPRAVREVLASVAFHSVHLLCCDAV